jgi:hypothetical protein
VKGGEKMEEKTLLSTTESPGERKKRLDSTHTVCSGNSGGGRDKNTSRRRKFELTNVLDYSVGT